MGGFIVLLKHPQLTVGRSKGWNINYLQVSYTMGQSFDLNTVASAYGPSF